MFLTNINLGALTSKVSAYKYRSWELETKEVLDIFDSLGVIGNVSIKGLSIIRILPNVTGIFDWISDKFRFSFDSLIENRALRIKKKKEEISLLDGLSIFNSYFEKSENISFSFNKSMDIIDSVNVKIFSQSLWKDSRYILDSFNNMTCSRLDERNYFYINFFEVPTFKNLILWGLDLRLEFPLLEVFLIKKMKFAEIYFVGAFESIGFNLGNNLIKHWASFFNGQSLMIKNICKSFSLFLSGSGVFGRLSTSGRLLEKVIPNFFNKISLLKKLNVLKYNNILAYISDINMLELGLFEKNIGGTFLSNDLLFAIDSTDMYFTEQYKYKYKIGFNAYNDQNKLAKFDVVFPINVASERSYVSYNLQGGLNFCEKIINKGYSKFSLANYLNIFTIFLRYRSILGRNIKNFFVKVSQKNNLFWTNFERKTIRIFKLYILQYSYFNSIKIGSSMLDVNLSVSNVISNYYYTHKALYYSPTILLADSRMFRKIFTFN